MATLALAEAEALVANALTRSRTSAENARAVAKALVLAEADGIKSHGLIRLPLYAAQAKKGKVDGFATPSAKRTRPGVAVIDANNGFAYPAIDLALTLLPEMARACGIAAAGIGRSHHCGAAGHHAVRTWRRPGRLQEPAEQRLIPGRRWCRLGDPRRARGAWALPSALPRAQSTDEPTRYRYR